MNLLVIFNLQLIGLLILIKILFNVLEVFDVYINLKQFK